MKFVGYRIVSLLIALLITNCSSPKQETIIVQEENLSPLSLDNIGPSKLSEYGFFKSPINLLLPTDSVLPYSLNSALFSDYAFKKRFIKFPNDQAATYHATEVLEFPIGTILIKNFYYPADFSKPESDWRIIETRLLINSKNGWTPLTYIWNEDQSEAFLDIAGKSIEVSWKHTDESIKNIKYSIPNQNQCKSCHIMNGAVMPIGPTARQLNRALESGNQNQLEFLKASNKLKDLPPLHFISKLADYNDQTQSIEARARGWLEVNCGHCHRAEGPAKTSGLHLLASIDSPMKLGIGKAPVAAGKGSGGLLYDVVPGEPDKSILFFRITTTDPGIMMPELGRTIIHQEAVDLIRQWIKEMK